MTRTVLIDPPEVGEHQVRFSWRVDPPSELYARESFNLRFGDRLAPRELPEDIWWTVALLCLHVHWALLRPCRVELPVELPPGEREFWLRLIDAAVETLERTWGGRDLERSVELADRGPRLTPAAGPRRDRVALAFSGGKDSLATLGMLLEFGERPDRGHHHLADVAARRPRLRRGGGRRWRRSPPRPDTEHVEVRSNLRECWDNSFAHRRGYPIAINELADTHLYLSAALAVGWARGAEPGRARVGGRGAAQRRARRRRRPTSPLHVRGGHPALAQPAARAARDLLRLAHLPDARLAGGPVAVAPLSRAARASVLVLAPRPRRGRLQRLRRLPPDRADRARRRGRPGARWGSTPTPVRAHGRVGAGARRRRAARTRGSSASSTATVVRELAAVRTRRFAARLVRADPRRLARRETRETVRNYARLRGRVAPRAAEVPTPGYRHAWLTLVDERWRDRLEALLDSRFERAPESEDRRRARARPEPDRADHRAAGRRRMIEPRLADRGRARLEIRHLIPDPEPALGRPSPTDGEPAPEQPLRVSRAAPGRQRGRLRRRVRERRLDLLGRRLRAAVRGRVRGRGRLRARGRLLERDRGAPPGAGRRRDRPGRRGHDPDVHDDRHRQRRPPARRRTRPRRLRAGHREPRPGAGRPRGSGRGRRRSSRFTSTGTRSEIDPLREIADGRRRGRDRGRRRGARGELPRPAGGQPRRRRGVLVLRQQDHHHRRGRHGDHRRSDAGGPRPRAPRPRVFGRTPLLAPVGRLQLPDEQPAGGGRAGADRAPRRAGASAAAKRAPLRGGARGDPGHRRCRASAPTSAACSGCSRSRSATSSACSRDELRRRLAARGIETRTFFVPIHLQPAYFDAPPRRALPGRRASSAQTGLYLPSGPGLAEAEIDYVARRAGARTPA